MQISMLMTASDRLKLPGQSEIPNVFPFSVPLVQLYVFLSLYYYTIPRNSLGFNFIPTFPV